MLQDNAPFFVADLQTDERVRLIPIDQDCAEVGVEVLKPDSMRIDFVHKTNAGLCDVAAWGVQAAAGDVDERDACRIDIG